MTKAEKRLLMLLAMEVERYLAAQGEVPDAIDKAIKDVRKQK